MWARSTLWKMHKYSMYGVLQPMWCELQQRCFSRRQMFFSHFFQLPSSRELNGNRTFTDRDGRCSAKWICCTLMHRSIRNDRWRFELHAQAFWLCMWFGGYHSDWFTVVPTVSTEGKATFSILPPPSQTAALHSQHRDRIFNRRKQLLN